MNSFETVIDYFKNNNVVEGRPYAEIGFQDSYMSQKVIGSIRDNQKITFQNRVELYDSIDIVGCHALAGHTLEYKGLLASRGEDARMFLNSRHLIKNLKGIPEHQLEALFDIYGGISNIPLPLFVTVCSEVGDELLSKVADEHSQAFLDLSIRLVMEAERKHAVSPGSGSKPWTSCLRNLRKTGIVEGLVKRGVTSPYLSYFSSPVQKLMYGRDSVAESMGKLLTIINTIESSLEMIPVDRAISLNFRSGSDLSIVGELISVLQENVDVFEDFNISEKDTVVILSALIYKSAYSDKDDLKLIVSELGFNDDAKKAVHFAKLQRQAGLLNGDYEKTVLTMLDMGFHPAIIPLAPGIKREAVSRSLEL